MDNRILAIVDVMEALKRVPSYTYNKLEHTIYIPNCGDKEFKFIFFIIYKHNLRFTYNNRSVKIWVDQNANKDK
jgi:hypothetical protein